MIKILLFFAFAIALGTPLIVFNLDPRYEVSTGLLGISLVGFFLLIFVLFYLFKKKK